MDKKNGYYIKHISIGGKSITVRGRTQAEIREKLAKKLLEIEKTSSAETVVENYLEQLDVSPNTRPGYVTAAHRFGEYFVGKDMGNISPRDVQQCLNTQISRHSMARKTASNHLTVVSRIFAYAVANGYCDMNAARDVTIPPNLPKTKRHMPEEEMIQAIRDTEDRPFGLIAFFALTTGLRKGEILALNFSDIDFSEKTIRVSKSWISVNNRPGIKEPKTAAGVRIVPLPDVLIPKLMEWRMHSMGDLVFPGLSGGLMTKTYYQRGWDRLQKEIGEVRIHELRHAYVTILLDQGIDLASTAAIVGHAQTSTTQQVYYDLREDKLKRARKNVQKIQF